MSLRMKKGHACWPALPNRGEQAGFTLIELLVVMAIIGILAALSLTSFNTAQKNTRDTRRKSDLGQYRIALEAYAAIRSGTYPLGRYCANPDCGHGESCGPGAGSGIFRNGGPLIPNYLPAKIPDPRETCVGGSCTDGQCTYRYRAYVNGQKYFLTSNLETGGFWVYCWDGRAGKINDLTDVPGGWDPGSVGDVGVDNTCNGIGVY